jgi:hypothetical protein
MDHICHMTASAMFFSIVQLEKVGKKFPKNLVFKKKYTFLKKNLKIPNSFVATVQKFAPK